MAGPSPGLIFYKTAFELTPITLTGGIAQNMPGGMLPLLALTDTLSFAAGLLSGGNLSIYQAFASFQPLSGSTLAANEIGEYTFANQAVAANSIIAQPLRVSMMMLVPAQTEGGFAQKLAVMTALQNTLAYHSASGGLFTVFTPSYPYTNCILTNLEDISASPQESRQFQIRWRFDFVQPLVTQQQAQQAQNSMMSKISSGVQTDGSLSGVSSTIGSPQTFGTPGLLPSASTSSSSAVAPLASAPQVVGPYGPS